MARIAGIEIPDDKKTYVSLTYVYGIGQSKAKEVLERAKIDGNILVKDLTEGQLNQLRSLVEEDYEVEGELRQKVFRNIKRLKDTKSYRGIRHKKGLPVRGQRTRCNARTRKGKGQPVGGLKRKLEKT